MKSSKPPVKVLSDQYEERHRDALVPAAKALEVLISDILKGQPRIDRVSARAKAPGSFLKKADATVGSKKKYKKPLLEIQDQIGARIVTFFRSDVERIDAIIKQYFTSIESKDLVPESEWEFGYFGRHHVLILPSDVKSDAIPSDYLPDCFELQIKTLFQHAWSEANHDVGYKPGLQPMSAEDNRKLAYTSAQAWGADHMFDELFQSQGKVQS